MSLLPLNPHLLYQQILQLYQSMSRFQFSFHHLICNYPGPNHYHYGLDYCNNFLTDNTFHQLIHILFIWFPLYNLWEMEDLSFI